MYRDIYCTVWPRIVTYMTAYMRYLPKRTLNKICSTCDCFEDFSIFLGMKKQKKPFKQELLVSESSRLGLEREC